MEVYPLVNIEKLWKITIFNGKLHYKWSFSIAMLNYHRVSLEKTVDKPVSMAMLVITRG